MGISAPGGATGNVPAHPYTPHGRPRPNVHGAAPGASGGHGLGAPSLGAEAPRAAAPPPPADRPSGLGDWKVPAMRLLADGLWVLAVLSPTLALSAAPIVGWLFPGWSWPLVAVGVGLTLLVTMALCMYGISLLERHSGGRPPAEQMRQENPLPPGAPADASAQFIPPLAPRGFTVFDVRLPTAPAASPRPVLPPQLDTACRETTRLMADTAGPDGEQRGMRLSMTCAAFAKAEASEANRAPWHREAWCSPDGMSYNAVFTQQRGFFADLLVLTLAEGMGIVTGDLSAREGPTELFGGLYGGGAFDRSLGMLGGELGGVYGAGYVSGRVNGGLNRRHETSTQVRSAQQQDAGPFVGTNTLAGVHAQERRDVRGAGFNVVPAWTVAAGALGAVRLFWRRDGKTIDQDTTVLAATNAELNAGTPPGARSAERSTMSAQELGSVTAAPATAATKPLARGLHAPQDLGEADSLSIGRDAYFGSLCTANALLTYLGRHHIVHESCTLSLRCSGRARVLRDGRPVWLPRLELTFLQRNQNGVRWLGSVAGGVGADTGSRTFQDERQVIELVGRAELAEPLELLWAAFRASERPPVRRQAWQHFVAMRGVKLKRELSDGTAHGREAGIANLPVCAGYLRNLFGLQLPSGFGEGLLPWQRGSGEVTTRFYGATPLQGPLQNKNLERLVSATWHQPAGAVAGPRGFCWQLVAAQLERTAGAGVQLQLLSRWSMSRADAAEVDGYILAPLRHILDQPRREDVAGMLDATAWRQSSVRHWRTSRQVDLDTLFDADELMRLGALSREDWGLLRDGRGSTAEHGTAFSEALRQHLDALGAELSAQDPAWRALASAAADFVAATHLEAPALLRQALALRGDAGVLSPGAPGDHWRRGLMVLRTESDAYNDRAKNYAALAREAEQPADRRAVDFMDRASAEREACRAAQLQAEHDPFLDLGDRAAYVHKLGRYVAQLGRLAAPAA